MFRSRRILRNAMILGGVTVAAGACAPESPPATETSESPAQTSAAVETPATTSPAKPFFRPAGTGPAVWGPGDLYTLLATGAETNGAYFQFEAFVPPGGGPPPHLHRGEDETFYLVQGTLEMRLGDETITAKPGDYVNVPRGTMHGFKNVGADTARMIATFVPAGMEKYFEEVFPTVEDRTAPAPPVTDELIQRMVEAAPRHRIEFAPPEAAKTP